MSVMPCCENLMFVMKVAIENLLLGVNWTGRSASTKESHTVLAKATRVQDGAQRLSASTKESQPQVVDCDQEVSQYCGVA